MNFFGEDNLFITKKYTIQFCISPRAGLDAGAKEKISSLPLLGIKPWSSSP